MRKGHGRGGRDGGGRGRSGGRRDGGMQRQLADQTISSMMPIEGADAKAPLAVGFIAAMALYALKARRSATRKAAETMEESTLPSDVLPNQEEDNV
mmetsp:Transcript_4785/g.7169  ORF Transcript_4785/g.7169 Transcript_4785/m.7169 type:complete len:96 (-) Transcript_4785:150-437(-)